MTQQREIPDSCWWFPRVKVKIEVLHAFAWQWLTVNIASCTPPTNTLLGISLYNAGYSEGSNFDVQLLLRNALNPYKSKTSFTGDGHS